jgi:hypothetical protein
MTLWDFNEDKNYTNINGYKVLKYSNAEKAAELLDSIHTLILATFISIELNEIRTHEINLLLSTPFQLQEMQIPEYQGDIIFEGLNKPKEVQYTNFQEIGKDGKLRAKYRLIFLNLRDSNNKLKNISKLKKLIAHELSHTALNHVRWRDDDHGKEFASMNKMILKYLN